jgi:hypothetical protein
MDYSLMQTKVCTGCKVDKPKTEYPKRYDRASGVRPKCTECQRGIDGKRRKTESGKKSYRSKAWKLQGIKITYEEYLAKYEKLNGCCEICNIKLDSLCVDHNHTTGSIRGLLCTACNLGIEHFKESEQNMNSAIKYLQNYKETI